MDPAPPPSPPPLAPWLVQGYLGLRLFLLAVYAAALALGAWAALGGVAPERGGVAMGVAIAAVGLTLGAAVAASFWLPRRPWAWSAHLIVICLGITLVVSAPIAGVLLWSWLAPEVRRHFE